VIPVAITGLLTLIFLLFLGSQVWRRHFDRGEATASRELTPVDLDAFENLTDLEEEQYLRANLSPGLFRGVQRSRIRAAKMYVLALSENAGTLMVAGQSARFHSDPEIAQAGMEIVHRAIRLKLWCLLSLLRLNAAMVFPTIVFPPTRIASQYLLVTCMVANLPRNSSALGV
jgi:hypothetical protein